MTTLLTSTTPSKDYPGVVPTYPIVRHLAERLIALDQPVRILTNAPSLSWPAKAEIFEGTPAEPLAAADAFSGIERLFLADADPLVLRELLMLALEGGLRKAVVLSSHGPDVEVEFEPESWHWLAIEVIVERTVPEWVHIRPWPLMGSALVRGEDHPDRSLAELVRNGQPIGVPHDDISYPHIHEDDLAEIAIKALFEADLSGKVLDLLGPLVSMQDKIDAIGASIGRGIEVENHISHEAGDDVSPSAFEMPPGADQLLKSLLGRPPRTFAQWVDEHRDAFM